MTRPLCSYGSKNLVQKLVGGLELFKLLIGEVELEDAVGARAVDDAGIADKDVLAQTVFAAQAHRAGKDAVLV